jgi:transposase InsO family protein
VQFRAAIVAGQNPGFRDDVGSIRHRSGPTARYRMHMFDRVCREHEIEHRFTKPNHPWTNGQVERMNRSLKEATIKRYHYELIASSKSTWLRSSTHTTSPSD